MRGVAKLVGLAVLFIPTAVSAAHSDIAPACPAPLRNGAAATLAPDRGAFLRSLAARDPADEITLSAHQLNAIRIVPE